MHNKTASERPGKARKAMVSCYCFLALFLLGRCVHTIDANASAAASMSTTVSEYQVKALYLYYFASFINWPASSFPTKTSPIIIGIIGNDNLGNLVEEAVRNKTVQERPIVVRRLKWSEEIKTCHMLFIGLYEHKQLAQHASVLQSAPILTVTETEERLYDKGIINLFMEGGKVQFEVNITAADKAQLRISSKLLRMAKITREIRL